MVQTSTTSHGASAIADGRQQVGVQHGCVKQRLPVNSHLHGLLAEMVAAGGHKPQFVDTEVGAESGDASDVQGTCWLDQYNNGVQGIGNQGIGPAQFSVRR